MDGKPFEDLEIGKLKNTGDKYDNPTDWLTEGLITFCYMISRDYPDDLCPAFINKSEYSYTEGLRALENALVFYATPQKFVKAKAVDTLEKWYTDAILEFLTTAFQVIPSKWHKGSDRATDDFMIGHKRAAIRRTMDKLEMELKQIGN